MVEVVKTYDAELSALVEAWLTDMTVGARPCAADTIKTHRKHMAKYVRVLLGEDPAATLTWGEAASERALGRAIASLPVTQFATRYNLYMAVMSWTRFLAGAGLMGATEREAMKRHKPRRLLPPRRTVLHSTDEISRFMESLWAAEGSSVYEKTLNAAMVGTMVYAGLRVSETAGLLLSNVDLAGGMLAIHNGKGGKPRVVGVNARLRALLEAYLGVRGRSSQPELFLAEKGTALTREYLGRRIRRIAKRACLDVSAHGLRRTFATLASDAGRSVNHIQLALGHSSIATTQAYLMADQAAAARAMRGW
jgi:site-specific recombinase XerD